MFLIMIFWLVIRESADFQIFTVKMDPTNYALIDNVEVNEPLSIIG